MGSYKECVQIEGVSADPSQRGRACSACVREGETEFSPVLAELRNFRIKLAEDAAEIGAAQQLRYEVFKLEQGRLAGCSASTDSDRYDSVCRHLIVIEKSSGRVVGTYRVLDAAGAVRVGGFYSEEEFAFRGLDRIAAECLEVGRSCVAPEFRNGAVIGLLWSGLAVLHRRRQILFRYLFGSVSLEDSDPLRATALYEYFRAASLLSGRVEATACPGYELEPVSSSRAAGFLERNREELPGTLPPLLKGYLNLGARLCGPPAFDRQFGTVDFPILLDFREIPERYLRHFGG